MRLTPWDPACPRDSQEVGSGSRDLSEGGQQPCQAAKAEAPMAEGGLPNRMCTRLRSCARRLFRVSEETLRREPGSEVRFLIQNHLHVTGIDQSELTLATHNHYDRVGS